METMGDRIHKKRIELGMTMDELGAKVGVQKSAVNKWEKNVVENIKRSIVADLADAFECDPVWLMYGDEAISEDVGVATELYNKYKNAPPEIRAAIDTLLKSTE